VKGFKTQTRARGSRIDTYYITLEFNEKDKKRQKKYRLNK